MSEKIENIIEESLSPDRYCLVHNYIVSLRQKVEQLEKEIDRLNNIINELEKWLEDNLGNCRTNQNYTSNQIYNLKEDTYYRCLNKLKALKEENKDE